MSNCGMKRICICCAALVGALVGVGETAAVSVTHSRARLGTIAERKAPNGDRMLYGLGYCLQVGPTTAAVLVNRNVYSSQVGVWDFEDGVDAFLIDSLEDLATAKPIPVIRSGAEPDPDSGGRMRYHNRYPIGGGFVPLGALVNGKPHPHAGTGFGVSTTLTYDLAPDGTFRQGRGNVKEYQIFYELKYDGNALSARPVDRAFKGNRLPIGTTGWEFVAGGLTLAIPDGEDLLAAVRARDVKSGQERPWTPRVGAGNACGISRWRRIEGRWKPVDFTPVAFSDSAHNYYEPSLVRDAKGDLVFGVRDDGRPWQKVGWELGEQDLNAWKSSDGGKTWRQIVHAEKVRSNSPTSVGRTADGAIFVAGNFQKGYRRHLALWPVLGDGGALGAPVTVRNAETEFKPNTSQWLIDHPASAILRLKGGKIVSVLSYRARDDFWRGNRNCPVTVPSPEAGCYIETVSSSGKPVPVWEFL